MRGARTLLMAHVLLDVLHAAKAAPSRADTKETADMTADTPLAETPAVDPASSTDPTAAAPVDSAPTDPAPTDSVSADPASAGAPTPAPGQDSAPANALAIMQAAAQLAQFLSQNKDVLAFMSTLTGASPPPSS